MEREEQGVRTVSNKGSSEKYVVKALYSYLSLFSSRLILLSFIAYRVF